MHNRQSSIKNRQFICDLIIPALDEAKNIHALFDELEPLRTSVIRNVIVSDNGSRDETPTIAKSRGAIVVTEPQRGYGAACLKAIEWISNHHPQPDVIAFLDADLADDSNSLPALLEPIHSGKVEMVIGSRKAHAKHGSLNSAQRYGGMLACFLMKLSTGKAYTDLGPFRAVRWNTLQRLQMADRTWGWTVEMQMKAALLDIPTCEIDVPYRNRRYGRSKISGTIRGVVLAGSKIIFTIVQLWWQRRAIRLAAQR